MDIDDSAILARGPMLDESAAAAAAVEAMRRSLAEGAERRASLIPASSSSGNTGNILSENKVMKSFTPGYRYLVGAGDCPKNRTNVPGRRNRNEQYFSWRPNNERW
jgi:hypothetical protein